MNVLIIPEDFRNDQYMLKPILRRLFITLNCSNPRVNVCQDPLLGGIGEALKEENISKIIDRYKAMTDIFILCVDRDGEPSRRIKLDNLESKFSKLTVFLAENAREEIETWVLAGLKLPPNWSWNNIRSEIHVKEAYFEKLARARNVSDGPGGGRKILGEQASRKIATIRQKCPEDFNNLALRLESRI